MAQTQRQDRAALPQTVERAPAQTPKVALSIFDLDRTLTIQPTYTRFLLFAARHRAPWRLLLVPLLIPAAILYAAKLLPRRLMKQAMHRLALGRALPEREAARLADLFARQLVAGGLYPEGVALIEAERRAGRRVLLATAAPHFYTAALARQLGIADVIASGSSWQDGCLLPSIDGANCYGAAKRQRIEAFLGDAGITRDTAHIRFYSDHASDLPLFELCDEARAVNPSRGLRAIAAARGWPVLDWRGRQG